MSLFERTSRELAPQNYLGAREITSFDGLVANDNDVIGAHRIGLKAASRWWVLPAAAFTGGLTAALIVTGLSDWFGITS